MQPITLVKLIKSYGDFFFKTSKQTELMYCSVRVPSSGRDKLLQANQPRLLQEDAIPSRNNLEFSNSKAFCGKSRVGAGPWLFAPTFLMRLTTHDKLSYMETESKFLFFFMFPKALLIMATQIKK